MDWHSVLAVVVSMGGVAFLGVRNSWGCKLGLHRYKNAFQAVHPHQECVKCGKRRVIDIGVGSPIDYGWLETGEKTVMVPPSGKRSEKLDHQNP